MTTTPPPTVMPALKALYEVRGLHHVGCILLNRRAHSAHKSTPEDPTVRPLLRWPAFPPYSTDLLPALKAALLLSDASSILPAIDMWQLCVDMTHRLNPPPPPNVDPPLPSLLPSPAFPPYSQTHFQLWKHAIVM